MLNKMTFRKFIIAGLGVLIFILSVIIILSFSEKRNYTFILIFFVLAVVMSIVSVFYAFYSLKARRSVGYKGIEYIIASIYALVMTVMVVYSFISSMLDIVGNKIIKEYGSVTFSQSKPNYSGAFLSGFILVIITEVSFFLLYIADTILTLKSIKKSGIQLIKKRK